jgi:hypothetical protein
MAIAKKGRRNLVIAERLFIWYVAPDEDSNDLVLHVASDDKKFMVLYPLAQPADSRLIIVVGREFAGLPDAGGVWVRLLCPAWENAGVIGPGDVRRLIEWSQDPQKAIVRVDWQGRVIDRKARPAHGFSHGEG